MTATSTAIELAAPPFGDRLEILFARLASAGIKIGLHERVIAARILSTLTIDREPSAGADEFAFRLRARLTPLLAKSPEEAARVGRAFRDVFGECAEPPRPDLNSPLERAHIPPMLRGHLRGGGLIRRLVPAMLGGVVLVALAVAWVWVRGPQQAPVGPVPVPSAASAASQLDSTAPTPQPAAQTGALTTDETTPLVYQVIGAAFNNRFVSIQALAQQMTSDAAESRALIGLFERYLSRAPDETFFMNEAELTSLVNALAAQLYPGRTAAPDVTASAIAAAGLDKMDSSGDAGTGLPLPPPSESLVASPWVTGAILALPIAVLFLWLGGRRRRLRDYLRRRTPRRPPLVHELVVRASADVMRERTLLTRAALRLGRLRQGLSRIIDAEATAVATARGAGFPRIMFAPARVSPEYLVLISAKGPEDHVGRQLDHLASELAAQNVSITRYFIAHDANLCFESPDAGYFTLDQMATRYPDHRLIFLGSGDQFINPATFAIWPWADDIASWERRAILTPKPIEEWGSQEMALAHLFDSPPLHADAGGLLRLAEHFERHEPPGIDAFALRHDPLRRSWTLRHGRWLTPLAPEEADIAQLERELALYFVDDRGVFDEAAFCWFAACAVYPALRWDLTIYLGLKLRALRSDGVLGLPLYSEERALRLAALPWFREAFMPHWLRRRMLERLPAKVHVQTAALLRELLDRAVKAEGESGDAVRLRIAQEGSDPRVARPERDEIFLDALVRADPLAFEVRRSLRALIAGTGDAFVMREWATLGTIAVYWIALALIVPWPGGGPLSTAAGLPLLLLPFAFLTWPFARRVAAWARQ
jgi:hypothetical protein